jgi:large subunit ribosomal protein L13
VSTYVCRPKDIQRKWILVDAEGKTLGRLSTFVAKALMGKHRPGYEPFLDTGDFVIVVNAEKVRLTGRKIEGKMYRWHTGYPGGLKQVPAGRMLREHPERLIEWSVKGMLPKGPLGRRLGTKLKAYRGPEHPHAAQQPEKVDIKA